jgi:hypothetical protein
MPVECRDRAQQFLLGRPFETLFDTLERQDAITDLLGLGKDSMIREALKTFGGVCRVGAVGQHPESILAIE